MTDEPAGPILVPEYFRRNPDHRTHFRGELGLVEYRTYHSSEQIQAEVTGLIFTHVFRGTKKMRGPGAECVVNAGESVLVPHGTYVMSEWVASEGEPYESLLLALDEGFMEELAVAIAAGTFDQVLSGIR